MTSARVGGGGAGKKWSRRAELMLSGVSLSGKEEKRGCCRPHASFFASHTEEGEREERYSAQWANLAFLIALK